MTKTGKEERLTLAEALGTAEAGRLREALLAAKADVVLEGGAVSHLGAAAVETIIAAGRRFAAEGRSLRLEAPSEALLSCAKTLGALSNLPIAKEAA